MKRTRNAPTTDRRDFLKLSALAGAALMVHGCAGTPTGRRRDANSKLNLAVVGCGEGGKGFDDLHSVASENIVALCDVDWKFAAPAFAEFPQARRYYDFRDLFDAEQDLDGVVVSTPDHTHAVIAAAALQRGLGVYCQKPLTHSIEEARLLAQLAKASGAVTQMGNQGTGTDGFRAGVEMVRSGALGEIGQVHVWTNRPIWPQAIPRPAEVQPIPATLRWDLFLGPAPYRPYNEAYHPFAWRGFWDYGTGALGDMACHIMNLAFFALELGAPESVTCEEQEGNNVETAPSKARIKYVFPANDKRGKVELYWYDGSNLPPSDLLPDVKLREGGSILVGSEGKMYVDDDYGQTWHLYPEEKFKDRAPPEPTLPRAPRKPTEYVTDPSVAPEAARWMSAYEWIHALKGQGTTQSHFGHAGPFTEAVLLGNVALRTGKEIRWDAEAMRATGCPEADALIRKTYSRGFTLTGLCT